MVNDALVNTGKVLRRLIEQNYSSQEEFAYDFGADLRTVNRYVNNGINKVSTLQELSMFFQIEIGEFFQKEQI